MKPHNLLNRITIDPEVMAGQPVIKGTRLTVTFILGLMAQGMSIPEILQEYNKLTKEDILACLSFAQHALIDHTFVPLTS